VVYLIPFILGVIFVAVNGLTQLVFAQTQGFKLKPASIGLLIAAFFSGIWGLVTPITGQSAMIALAGKTRHRRQRVAALLLSSLMMVVLGLTGAVSAAINFAGPAIMAGMMAGVGLMLMKIGSDFIFHKHHGNLGVGLVSILSALLIWFFTTRAGSPNNLVYTVAGSVLLSTAYYLLFQRDRAVETRPLVSDGVVRHPAAGSYSDAVRNSRNIPNAVTNPNSGEYLTEVDYLADGREVIQTDYLVADGSAAVLTADEGFDEGFSEGFGAPIGETDNGRFWTKEYWQTDDWKIVRPKFTFQAVLAALALFCLGIGITTSFGNINANLAGGIEQNFDHLTLASGIAGFASELFGGMPLETIISGTAAAPWPVWGNVAVLVLLAILLILGVVTRISRYIPTQSIAGFLIVIGLFATFLPQLRNPGFASDIPVAGVTMAVTALTSNPFLGVLAGLVIRALGHFVGLA